MQIERIATMSRLAWVAHVASDQSISAFIGDWVEEVEDGLVEGAWNGVFGDAGFLDSYSFTGSGVVERPWGALVAGPCHTTELLYSLQTPGSGVHVSNSVALLLKAAGAELDLDYLDYEYDALSVSRGLLDYRRNLPLADERSVGVHAYCNIRVGFDGTVTEAAKPEPEFLENFIDYRKFLKREVAGVLANAAAPERRAMFAPIVFLSKGYDSTLCAVIGREAGCDEAVTYESKRKGRSDLGDGIAEALGYSTIHRRDELEYQNHDVAHLFCANGELGVSIFFGSAGDLLTGKILLSGAHGDKMWSRDYVETAGPIVRSFYPDIARSEFRLEVGYLNFPPAFLTATQQPAIQAVSKMPDMAKWTLGNDYDRPIARRIGEEAGVPREAFGVAKKGGAGSSLRFGNRKRVQNVMPKTSWLRFEPYLAKAKRSRRKGLLWTVRSVVYCAFLVATVATERVKLLRPVIRLDDWPTQYKCSPFAPSFLFPWAVAELQTHTYRDVPVDPLK